MIRVGDLEKWVKDATAADTGGGSLAALVPGGFWAKDRVGEQAAAPYGSYRADPAGADHTVAGDYYPRFRVTVTVYADQNKTVAGNDAAATRRAIDGRLAAVFRFVTVNKTLRNGLVVGVLPAAGPAPFAPQLRNGNDVVLTSFTLEVNCAGRTDEA